MQSETHSWTPHNTKELRKYLIENVANPANSHGERSQKPLNYTEGVDMSDFVEVQGDIIGSGGFGDVYKGRWRNIPKGLEKHLPVIAVKVIRAVILQDPTERSGRMKKIEREVRVWHACAHKNVLPLIGFARLKGDSNLPALITFWMDNGNVKDYLQANPEAPKLTLITEVVEGLTYLHCRKLCLDSVMLLTDTLNVERLNVLVDLEGHAYLCDFGLSRMTEDNTLWNTSATHAGGSMRWMAPELLLASQSFVSTSSDMYAYAMTCFEILSGKIPFFNLPSDATVIVAVAIQNRRPERESLDISEDLWEVISNCWQTNPGSRPSASEALEAIVKLTKKMALPDETEHDSEETAMTTGGPPLPSSFVQKHYMSSDPVKSLAYSPDSTRLVSGESGDTVRLWDIISGKLLFGPLEGHTHHVTSVAYVPDGVRFVSGAADKTIRVWNAYDGSCVLGPLTGHTNYVQSVVCSPDGFWFASCAKTRNDAILLWSLSDGSILSRINYQNPHDIHGLAKLALSTNGSKLVACTLDSKFYVFDVPSRSLKASFHPEQGCTSWCISPASDILAIGLYTGEVVFVGFDGKPAPGFHPAPPLNHSQRTLSVCFSPDTRIVVSGHMSGHVRIWDAKSGKPIELHDKSGSHSHPHMFDVEAVAFAPDGKSFTSAAGRTMKSWEAVWPPGH